MVSQEKNRNGLPRNIGSSYINGLLKSGKNPVDFPSKEFGESRKCLVNSEG